MNAIAKQLFEAAMQLSEDERVQLAEELIASSSEAKDVPFDESWMTEVRQRSDEIDAGTASLLSWEEARRDALSQARSRRRA